MAASNFLNQLLTIDIDTDSNLYVMGYTNQDIPQIFYGKMDINGNFSFVKTLGLSTGSGTYFWYDNGHKALSVIDDSILMTGYTYPLNDSASDLFIANMPTTDNIQDGVYGRWHLVTPPFTVQPYSGFDLGDSGFGLSASDISTSTDTRTIIDVDSPGQEIVFLSGGIFSVDVLGKLNMNNYYSLPSGRGQFGQTLVMPQIGNTLVWANAARGQVGNDGGNTGRWVYNTTGAPSDPGANVFNTDNDSMNKISVISISKSDFAGNGYYEWFGILETVLSTSAVFLTLTQVGEASIIGTFFTQGADSIVDNDSYVDITVSYFAGSTDALTPGAIYSLSWVINGADATLQGLLDAGATASIGNDIISVGEQLVLGPFTATVMGVAGPSQSVFMAYNDTVDAAAFAMSDKTSGGNVVFVLPATMSGAGNTIVLPDKSGILELVPIEYTPSGNADTFGTTGQITYDNNFMYIKTLSGWFRSTLTTF